ncbi:MAG: hypothetical protein IPO37_02820 [Saprospiraceae bacterium]|nr:hypothetical protein [Saprospiraceae bacterium]
MKKSTLSTGTLSTSFAGAIQAFLVQSGDDILPHRALRQAHEYLADDIIYKNSVVATRSYCSANHRQVWNWR